MAHDHYIIFIIIILFFFEILPYINNVYAVIRIESVEPHYHDFFFLRLANHIDVGSYLTLLLL